MSRRSGVLRLDGGDAINDALMGFWPLDDNGGTIVRDLSPWRRDGIVSAATIKRSEPPGRVLSFGGSQTVSVSGFSWNGTTPLSLSLWVRTTAAGGSALTIGNTTAPGTRFQTHLPWTDNTLYFDVGGFSGDARITASYSSFVNVWTHVVLINNGTNFKAIYINGALAASASTALSPGALSGLWIGGWPANSLWHTGPMRLFRAWNRILSPSDVRRLYVEREAGTTRWVRRTRAVLGAAFTGTPGAGAVTYAGQAPTVQAGAVLAPGAGTETYAGRQPAVTAGAALAPGAGAVAYQGHAPAVAEPAILQAGAGVVTYEGLAATVTMGGVHGVLRRHRRVRQWQDVPEPLKPVVALAENYADEAEVQRAVEAALARYAAMSARASVARRERLVDDMKRLIVEAVERAAEIDDEEALIALL